ncbi:hypothetical protein BpHYR1_007265 [Brachionus plicatilis]|uniref:Uncharacterized protein n=1 Tax=Brachionus plicatilis TaxID=10195 RepID=A0A3M7PQ06_BRAPC|nr:hypothetical protein BpHYR1_007265 [Brachionus plicatilis]
MKLLEFLNICYVEETNHVPLDLFGMSFILFYKILIYTVSNSFFGRFTQKSVINGLKYGIFVFTIKSALNKSFFVRILGFAKTLQFIAYFNQFWNLILVIKGYRVLRISTYQTKKAVYSTNTLLYRKPLPSILGINLKFNRNSIWNSSHRNHVKNSG